MERLPKVNERPVERCEVISCGQVDASDKARELFESHGAGIDFRVIPLCMLL